MSHTVRVGHSLRFGATETIFIFKCSVLSIVKAIHLRIGSLAQLQKNMAQELHGECRSAAVFVHKLLRLTCEWGSVIDAI